VAHSRRTKGTELNRWPALPAALLALIAAVAIAGCGSSSSSSSSSEASTTAEAGAEPATEAPASEEGGAAGSGTKAYYLSPVLAQPAQQDQKHAFEAGAKELGWSPTVLDSALSPEKEISNMEIARNGDAKAIGVWTLDPGTITGSYEAAQKAGIPVIGDNSAGPGITDTVWFETQLCEPDGPQAVDAEKIAEIHPGAKVMMIVFEQAQSLVEVAECFAQEAKKAGLEVISETNNEADNAAGSQKQFEPLLTKTPDVEAVWCYNDESALGVSAALLAQGKQIATTESPEGVVVTGQNGDKGAIEAVEEGRMSWTWDPDNIATGYALVKAMNAALEGKPPKDILVEGQFVDSETVGEYVWPEEREYTLATIPIKWEKPPAAK
jgi:ribose transport system substrate-binding protein